MLTERTIPIDTDADAKLYAELTQLAATFIKRRRMLSFEIGSPFAGGKAEGFKEASALLEAILDAHE